MAKLKKNKKKKFFINLTITTWILGLLFLVVLFLLDVIPLIYFGIISFVIFILECITTFFVLSKEWKRRFLGTIFSIIFIVIMIFALFYSGTTLNFLGKIESVNVNTKNYSVVVLNNSEFEKLKDLKEKVIGVTNSNGIEKAKNHIDKKTKVNFKDINDEENLVDLLYEKKVDAILLEDSEKIILEEEHEDFVTKEKVIYTFTLDIKIDADLAKEVNISKESFNIFVTGIDTYGKISTVSRSDVNMVITINPKTHQILFTSIPRDYYVKLHGVDTNYKDKLTHAGIHGIDVSIKTVEDLLDIDINYYAKVNFTSLVTLVNELGGIDVENDMNFAASYNEFDKDVYFEYKKGLIHLNGEQALAYARERYSLARGDLARNKHQQIVLEGIIKKVLSPNIITKYNAILKSLENNFVTNIGSKNITKLVKDQIKNNYDWTIQKYALIGTDDYEYTYAYKSAKSYVMIPNDDSLNEAKTKIKEIMVNF